MKHHNSIVRFAPLSLAALLFVAGCGQEDDHAHGPDGDHVHEGAERAGHADAEATDGDHDHGEGTHAHEAPATEAIYADDTGPAASPRTGAAATDAAAADADASEVSDSEAHTHGDGSRHEH